MIVDAGWTLITTPVVLWLGTPGSHPLPAPPSSPLDSSFPPNSTITDRQYGTAACCLKCRLSLNFSVLIKRLLSEKLKELGHVYTSNKIYVRLFLKYNSATLEILSKR